MVLLSSGPVGPSVSRRAFYLSALKMLNRIPVARLRFRICRTSCNEVGTCNIADSIQKTYFCKNGNQKQHTGNDWQYAIDKTKQTH